MLVSVDESVIANADLCIAEFAVFMIPAASGDSVDLWLEVSA